jgi:hypothetical protein
MPTTLVTPPSASVYAGVARRDLTPPLGMYNRIWGAALHDVAEGVHRPLTATALAIRAEPQAPPLLLISLDWCLIVESQRVLAPLVQRVGGDAARVIVNCTHTHSIGFVSPMRADQPGGRLLEPYLERAIQSLCEAADEAIALSSKTPAIITAATGRCGLATNRDLPDPADATRYVCGYNPDAPADDTLLVLRVAGESDGKTLATVVNYACHPTTLAWQNKRFSPDYIGAMRELVEQQRGGLCLFLQGASGNLAPAHQYVGDERVPEQHGRQLGFAVLSTLEGMLGPGYQLAYEGVKESGAPLALWRPRRFEPSRRLEARQLHVDLPRKPWPSLAQVEAQLQACSDRALSERLRRQAGLIRRLDASPTGDVWVWHVGDIILVAQHNEAYPDYQQHLRAARPRQAVVVMNVSNNNFGYLYPRAIAGDNIYPVWQSPFAENALEELTQATLAAL